MGFPTIPSRLAFGPQKSNLSAQSGDARYYENAEESNLIRWQLAGLGFFAFLVKVTFTTAATTNGLVLVRHKYAWDQDLTPAFVYTPPAAPTFVRTGVGVYTVTVPALGFNELGAATIPIELLEAEAHAQTGARRALAATNGLNEITVTVRDAVTGAVSDTATTVVVKAGR